MTIKTSIKLAELEEEQKERIAKLEQKLEKKKMALVYKRKEQLFKIFNRNSLLAIDDELLLGFLKFSNDENNKDHPILKEFKILGSKTTLSKKQKNLNQ